jgi:aldehyde dehydrogenase (NAD+)
MDQKIQFIFDSQQAYKYTLRKTNVAQRIAKLKVLKHTLLKFEQQIYDALQKDLRKSKFETAVTELYFIYGELDFAIQHLGNWMRPKGIGKTWNNLFAKNRLIYEPKGVCLIISPWNYPLQLSLSPLISAIAAGNCVVLKPSEISTHTSAIVAQIVAAAFESREVACLLGNAETATELLTLPFDHIFFTGSTPVGKIVMAAAAKNLASVTLELGGKSPTIIDSKANLKVAAEKIAWGKLINSGQTCIAPDYVLVPQHQLDEFVALYQAAAQQLFFKSASEIDPSAYCKLINRSHFLRLKAWVDEAVANGAKLNWCGKFEEETLTIHPIVISQIPEGMKLMEEEIFGPILPVIPYENLPSAVAKVNESSKPLALYIFSESKKNIEYIITNTSAGGTCVNDVLVHIANPKLPFGGVNGSGMGSSHGIFGFKNFAHERAIVYQRKLNFNSLIYPPYLGKDWVLKLLKKIM